MRKKLTIITVSVMLTVIASASIWFVKQQKAKFEQMKAAAEWLHAEIETEREKLDSLLLQPRIATKKAIADSLGPRFTFYYSSDTIVAPTDRPDLWQDAIYCYFTIKDGYSEDFRIRIRYTGKDSLCFGIAIVCLSESDNFQTVYWLNMEKDDIGDLFDFPYESYSSDGTEIASEVSDTMDITIKIPGKSGGKVFKLTKQQIRSIRETYLYFQSLTNTTFYDDIPILTY